MSFTTHLVYSFVSFSIASLALLPELVTNVPLRGFVKHLYSTLGCVISFNPVPNVIWLFKPEEEKEKEKEKGGGGGGGLLWLDL